MGDSNKYNKRFVKYQIGINDEPADKQDPNLFGTPMPRQDDSDNNKKEYSNEKISTKNNRENKRKNESWLFTSLKRLIATIVIIFFFTYLLGQVLSLYKDPSQQAGATICFGYFWIIFLYYFLVVYVAIDIANKENVDIGTKIIWVLLLLFIPVIPIIAWIFFGPRD